MHHSAARRFGIVLPLACLLLLAGCGDEPALGKDATPLVAPSALAGKWVLTPASLEMLKRDGYVETADLAYTIDLGNDGWLKFASVVDDVKGGSYANCIGSWRLDHDAIVENQVRVNVVELQLLRPGSRYFLKLSVKEEDGNFVLWNTYGDPKALEQIEYRRPDFKRKLGW